MLPRQVLLRQRENAKGEKEMGLKDLLKKALTGASDEDNRKNKAKMREIFNSLVADGDAYTLIYCHMENSHNAVVVEVNVHSNYIVGYKPGEVVIVPVNGQLTEWARPRFSTRRTAVRLRPAGPAIARRPRKAFTISLSPLPTIRESKLRRSTPLQLPSPRRKLRNSASSLRQGSDTAGIPLRHTAAL